MKIKSLFPVKFDNEGFFIAWGFGLVSIVVGILLIDGNSSSTDLPGTSKDWIIKGGLAHLLQKSNLEIVMFFLGNCCLLVGVLAIFRGLKIFIQYLSDKVKD